MLSDDGSDDAAMETQNDSVAAAAAPEDIVSSNDGVAHDDNVIGTSGSIINESTSANESTTTSFDNPEDNTELRSGESPTQSPSPEVTDCDDAQSSSVPTDCQADTDFVNVPTPEQVNGEMAAPMESDG
eukprot:Lankesteria_metandrocarpae@DN7782_c0_g1_i1.p1